jgi:hypothetical protein
VNPSPFDPGVMPGWAYTVVWVVGVVAAVALVGIVLVMARDWMRGRRK